MKNILILLLISTSFYAGAQQASWGIKGGLNYNLSEIGVKDAYNSIGDILEGEQSYNGWHAGLVSRIFMGETFFVQFQGMYSESKNIVTGKTQANQLLEKSFKKQVGQFDILGGFEFFNFLRAQGGLIGQISLNKDYTDTFNGLGLGYNLGVGVNIWKFNFDIGYNASFQNHEGEWHGIPLTHNTSEVLLSAGFMF